MRWHLQVFRRNCAASLSAQIQYPAAMLIFVGVVLLETVLYLVVWRVAAQGQSGVVGGLTQDYLTAYYIVLLVVNFLSYTWIFHRMEDRVRLGSFSVLLMRPVHPIARDIAENITFKLVTSIATVSTSLAEPASWPSGALVVRSQRVPPGASMVS